MTMLVIGLLFLVIVAVGVAGAMKGRKNRAALNQGTGNPASAAATPKKPVRQKLAVAFFVGLAALIMLSVGLSLLPDDNSKVSANAVAASSSSNDDYQAAVEYLGEARSTSTSPERLRELSQLQNHYVRMWVAENTAAPTDVVDMLAADSNLDVKRAAAGNSNISTSVVLSLMKDPDASIHNWAAGNPRMPPDMLRSLASSSDYAILNNVAGNPSTPQDILVRFAHSKNADIRGNVALNPSAPPLILFALAHDSDQDIRQDAADTLAKISRRRQNE